MSDRQRVGRGRMICADLSQFAFQAVREIRSLAGHWQVVFNEPCGLDNCELPVLDAIRNMGRVIV